MILEVCLAYGIELNTLLNKYNVQQVFSMYEYQVFKVTGERKEPVDMIDDSDLSGFVWDADAIDPTDGSRGQYVVRGNNG